MHGGGKDNPVQRFFSLRSGPDFREHFHHQLENLFGILLLIRWLRIQGAVFPVCGSIHVSGSANCDCFYVCGADVYSNEQGEL